MLHKLFIAENAPKAIYVSYRPGNCYWCDVFSICLCVLRYLDDSLISILFFHLMQEVSVLSGDQLMYQSMKCEPPETPPERTGVNPPNPSSPSAGILITSGASYKVPEASNNWKAEVKVRCISIPYHPLCIFLTLACRGFGISP